MALLQRVTAPEDRQRDIAHPPEDSAHYGPEETPLDAVLFFFCNAFCVCYHANTSYLFNMFPKCSQLLIFSPSSPSMLIFRGAPNGFQTLRPEDLSKGVSPLHALFTMHVWMKHLFYDI